MRGSSRPARLGLFLLLAALAWPGPGSAVEAGEAAGPAAAGGGNVATRVQALEKRIEEIRKQRPTKTFERVETQLAELRETATSATQRAELLLSGPATILEVEGQLVRWRMLERRFTQLEDEVRTEADVLDAALSEIGERTEDWARTRSEARSSAAPAAVVRTADEALAALSSVKRQVSADLALALQLLEQFEALEEEFDPTVERLEAEKQELAEGLWVRRDEAVWRSIPASGELLGLPGEFRARLTLIWQEFLPQIRDRRDAMIVQGLVFVVLAWLLTRARRGRERLHPEQAEARSDPLGHPWAAAYLIALLTSPYLQLTAVRGFRLVSAPFALAAWWIVLSRMVVPSMRGPLLGLGLLSMLEIFRLVFPVLPVVNRFVLGVDLALALAGVLWLRRPERLRLLPWQAVASPWVRLLAPAFAIALIALLLGYTALASSIALLGISGSSLGAAWGAFVRIGEGLGEHAVETDALAPLRMPRTSRDAFLRVLRRLLRGLGLFGWAFATLGVSGLWNPVRSAVAAVLSASAGFGEISISLGAVVAFFLTLWLAWLLARFVSFVLEQEVLSRVQTAPGVSFALSTFTRYAVLVIGFMTAIGAAGFSLDRVALLLSALGVGIGFGLQGVVNNFVSGLILLFERPIRVGDWVQLSDLFGTVTKLGIRASTVRTFDGSEVIVPNGDLISSQVTNWTLSDRKRRIILPVGVAYGTDPRRVLEVLKEVARGHGEVLGDPEPVALFRGFGDSSLNFELRVFTEGDWLRITSDLAVAITDALAAAGITIPFPQRDLHLRDLPQLREALLEGVSGPRGDRPGKPEA